MDTEPSPASRPRVGKFGAYYTKGYATFMADCQKQFAMTLVFPGIVRLDGPVAVFVETIIAKPKTSKLTAPRGDVDNYAKGPLDAATKAGVWGDDGQVIALATTKRFAEPGEAPGVNLHIGRLK